MKTSQQSPIVYGKLYRYTCSDPIAVLKEKYTKERPGGECIGTLSNGVLFTIVEWEKVKGIKRSLVRQAKLMWERGVGYALLYRSEFVAVSDEGPL